MTRRVVKRAGMTGYPCGQKIVARAGASSLVVVEDGMVDDVTWRYR